MVTTTDKGVGSETVNDPGRPTWMVGLAASKREERVRCFRLSRIRWDPVVCKELLCATRSTSRGARPAINYVGKNWPLNVPAREGLARQVGAVVSLVDQDEVLEAVAV